MKRALGFGAAGILAFGIFFILQIPASLLLERLHRYAPITVASTTGTLYRGQAEGLGIHGTALGALAWQWRPLALLHGALAYAVRAHDPLLDLQTQASLALLGGSLRLAPLRGKLPLTRAIALAGQPTPQLEGVLELAIDELSLGIDRSLQMATGVIRLRDLHTTFGRTLRFGDFTAQLQAPAQGQGVVGSISDDGGPLMMHGDLTLAPDGGYRFSGEFGVRDASDSQLKPILVGLLGAPEPDGKWRITFSGRLTK